MAIAQAYHSTTRVGGLTHGLYRYPARFSPELVRAAIHELSEPDDWVADPFVGGGTSAVEALAAGRRILAFDLNPLSTLLTSVKTTPLSPREAEALRAWANDGVRATADGTMGISPDPRLRNAPADLAGAFVPLRAAAESLPTNAARAAARAVMIHAGQQLIDGRSRPGEVDELPRYLLGGVARLVDGLGQLSSDAKRHGVTQGRISKRRILRTGRAHELASTRPFNRLAGRVRLVVTSPPYPGIHVLYHRWQVRGRSETPMAYWLSDLQDGLGPKHYTMGGRTQLGEVEYFETIERSWRAVHRLLAADATVVQVVAFAEAASQLPRYLAAMTDAGYERAPEQEPEAWRVVPNRKWYFRARPERGSAQEVLLVHRPIAKR